MKNFGLITFVLFISLISACSQDDAAGGDLPQLVTGSNFLQEAELITTVGADDIAAIPSLRSLASGLSFQDIHAYRVTYPTTYYDGQTVIASGLVLVPGQSGDLPLLSYQHGTIIRQQDAPSNFDRSTGLLDLIMGTPWPVRRHLLFGRHNLGTSVMEPRS